MRSTLEVGAGVVVTEQEQAAVNGAVQATEAANHKHRV